MKAKIWIGVIYLAIFSVIAGIGYSVGYKTESISQVEAK